MTKEYIIDCIEQFFYEIDDFKTLDYEFTKLLDDICDKKVDRHNQLVKHGELYRNIKE